MKKIVGLLVLVMISISGCGIMDIGKLKDPSPLKVSIDSQEIDAVLGTYSWYNKVVDTVGLPELADYQKGTLYAKPKAGLNLEFETPPNNYKIKKWNEASASLSSEEDDKAIVPKDKEKVIYEVFAEWDEGKAYYVFVVTIPE